MSGILKPILIACAFLVYTTGTFAQTKRVLIKKNTITIPLNIAKGIGPNGLSSLGIGSYEDFKNTEDFKAFPTIKNPPKGLDNPSQYFYITDQFQFYYQNYIAGVYRKEFFLEKAKERRWKLSDTIYLSTKHIKCSFAVYAGTDSTKKDVVIVDANNNYDFADDIVRPLIKGAYNQKQILDNSITVHVEYFSNGAVLNNEEVVFVQRAYNPQKMDLSFIFPQFDFARFSYQGNSYIICADRHFERPNICVIPDRPYFTQVSAADMVSQGNFAIVGDNRYKFISYDPFKHTLTLEGSPAGFVPVPPKQKVRPDIKRSIANIVSDQVGFKAPSVSGTNMNPVTNKKGKVSTSNLLGKFIFIDFWSTYCGPCIQELPNLNLAYQKYDRNVFEIIGVFDERDTKATKALFETNNVRWPNIYMNHKDTDISGYSHVNMFPTSYLIDPTGKIVGYDLRGEELMSQLKKLIGH